MGISLDLDNQYFIQSSLSWWRQPNLLRSRPIPVFHLPKAREILQSFWMPCSHIWALSHWIFLTSKNFLHAGLCLWLFVLSLGSPDPSLIPAERQLRVVLRCALACCHPWHGLKVIPCVGGMGDTSHAPLTQLLVSPAAWRDPSFPSWDLYARSGKLFKWSHAQ